MNWIHHYLKKMVGFSIVGVIVTIVSLLLIFLLNELLLWNQYLAFFLSYFSSIILSYWLNVRWVWKVKASTQGIIRYFGVYVSSMVLGMVLLRIFNLILPEANHTLLSYSTIPFTMVWNFLFVNKVLTKE
jgi:putative flippase GtrA